MTGIACRAIRPVLLAVGHAPRQTPSSEGTMSALDLEQRRCEEELRGLDAKIRDKLRRLFKLAGVPLVPTGDYWDLAAEDAAAAEAASRRKGAKPRRKPQARGWTVEDVRAKATPIQKR